MSPRLRACLVSLALVAGLCSVADAATPNQVAPTALAGGAPLAAMVDLETKMADSLKSGHAVPVVFASPDQLPGQVVQTPYWGDTALWSGVYMGGEAFRYSVAKDALTKGKGHKGLSREERDFWEGQLRQAADRVRLLREAQHRNINIAEDWNGTLRVPPAVNPDPGGGHTADFGGGVVRGERGMITRGCTPKGLGPMGINPPNRDAANPINDHTNHVFEITWTSGDGRTYYCETSPSRDTYAGMTFGMLTAFDLVGPDDPALQAQIKDDILVMADFLLKYGWNFPRPHGYVGTKNDEDGFLSPMMLQVPMGRLNITNAARHVAEVAGSAEQQAKWRAAWAEELASQGPLLGVSMEVDAFQPNEGYFKFNLHHLTGFNLMRTLGGVERDVIARGFAVMDKTTRDDVNAHFEAITFAMTGESARRDAAVQHLTEWLTYRQQSAQVRNSSRCGQDLVCVPRDRAGLVVEQAPGGSISIWPESPEAPPVSRSASLRAERPLPVALRPPSDFLWQNPPTTLDGHQGATWREPGIDYLTPYWMTRWSTEVARPAHRPLPEWVAPAHL